MGMRELHSKALSMRNEGKSTEEIYAMIWRGAQELGMTAGHGDHSNFEIRLVQTGETISFSPSAGYSYNR